MLLSELEKDVLTFRPDFEEPLLRGCVIEDILPFLVYFMSCNLYLVCTADTGIKKIILSGICGLALISAIIHAQGALSEKPHMWNVDPVNIDEKPDHAWDWSDPQFLRAIQSRGSDSIER